MARTTAFQADDSNSSESERKIWTDGNFIESIQSEIFPTLLKIFTLIYTLKDFLLLL